jgi:hypothetical protein
MIFMQQVERMTIPEPFWCFRQRSCRQTSIKGHFYSGFLVCESNQTIISSTNSRKTKTFSTVTDAFNSFSRERTLVLQFLQRRRDIMIEITFLFPPINLSGPIHKGYKCAYLRPCQRGRKLHVARTLTKSQGCFDFF